MFYFIRGTVAHTAPGLVVLDANGVGYAINTSYLSASSVRMGETATFYTYLYVREDIFDLYGFATQEELACFKQLIGISGVGPKAAAAILGVVSPQKLALAVVTGDEKALCQAPGIGKKLAQRIILELKDKMSRGQLEKASGIQPETVQEEGGDALGDALAALAVLGYSRAQALAALKGVDTASMPVDELVRAALKKLY